MTSISGCSARAEMRPRPSVRVESTPGLLRPRGDAPRHRRHGAHVDEAAPPARRCALTPRCGGAVADGCSARAEMRPGPGPDRELLARLLRPRGDAPSPGHLVVLHSSAAPPARRCAPGAVEAVGRDEGCSARAEMRPMEHLRGTSTPRLLRPRGDAPCRWASEKTQQRAAPPARRCAREWEAGEARKAGCSARAEMRPSSRRTRSRRRRLLRPRGDAPRWEATCPDDGSGCSARAEMRRGRAAPSRR